MIKCTMFTPQKMIATHTKKSKKQHPESALKFLIIIDWQSSIYFIPNRLHQIVYICVNNQQL